MEQSSQVAPTVTPVTSSSVPGGRKYAGFWIRLIALIVDGILIMLVMMPINNALYPAYTTIAGTGWKWGVNFQGPAYWTQQIIFWLYAILTTVYLGGTVGKLLFGLRVVNIEGQKISFGAAALREIVGKFISMMVILIGFIWVAFDGKKQGWHDKLAKTYVVRK